MRLRVFGGVGHYSDLPRSSLQGVHAPSGRRQLLPVRPMPYNKQTTGPGHDVQAINRAVHQFWRSGRFPPPPQPKFCCLHSPWNLLYCVSHALFCTDRHPEPYTTLLLFIDFDFGSGRRCLARYISSSASVALPGWAWPPKLLIRSPSPSMGTLSSEESISASFLSYLSSTSPLSLTGTHHCTYVAPSETEATQSQYRQCHHSRPATGPTSRRQNQSDQCGSDHLLRTLHHLRDPFQLASPTLQAPCLVYIYASPMHYLHLC